MHGQALTPKQVLAEKVSLREKQKKLLLRKEQREARLREQARFEPEVESRYDKINAAALKKSPEELQVGERVMLTPDVAMELLEHNTLNRPLSDQHVHRIAKQIIEGKWRFNGDTIKVADTGDVLDGQHRLWAIIEAKKPVETLVVYGIAKDAFATIDTLRRPRSGADVLALCGAARHRQIVSPALQWLTRWQRGVLVSFRDPKNRIENSDIEAAFAAHPAMVNAVERAMALRSLANPSVLGFIYYVMSNRNAELAERMMATLEAPAGVAIVDPFYKLREYFLADHHKRKEPLYTIALAFKAANAAYAGREIKVLKWVHQGANSEAFPELTVA